MTIHQTTLAAAFALAAIGPAHAEAPSGPVSHRPRRRVRCRLLHCRARGLSRRRHPRETGRGRCARAGRGRARPRPKPDALHPAPGGHPGRRDRDHQAGRCGHGRGSHELTMVAWWATPRRAAVGHRFRDRAARELGRGRHPAYRKRPPRRALDVIQDEATLESSKSGRPMCGEKFPASSSHP